MSPARLDPTPDDAAIFARQRLRLVRWMRARGDAGNPVGIAETCAIAMRATQDYLHFNVSAAWRRPA